MSNADPAQVRTKATASSTHGIPSTLQGPNRRMARWLRGRSAIPTDCDTNLTHVGTAVRLLTESPDAQTALDARQVQGWLQGHWSTDPRTTSSVYATARNAVWPWADPQVADTAEGCDIDLDWLVGGNNTLYLCAPLGDDSRIGVVFSVLLDDLITQAFEASNRTGEPIDPRLLVLLDETANTYLPKLAQWAATVSGAGVQMVTVWQSKGQIDELYGQAADGILTNSRTKLLYPSGLSDLATMEYFSDLAGTEQVRGDLNDPRALTAPTPYQRTPAKAVKLLAPNVLRQIHTGDLLIVHGAFAPLWVRNRAPGTWPHFKQERSL
jgi:type IV secretory pathway TraG/TraD family ATPase VirD4